jgi:hypothetical protein
VVVVLYPLHAKQFLIERRQAARVRAVDHEPMPSSNHPSFCTVRNAGTSTDGG